MKVSATRGVIAVGIGVAVGVSGLGTSVPDASAACSPYKSDGSLNWGCGWPSFPSPPKRGGRWPDPRPPLTPKNNEFCWRGVVRASTNLAWVLVDRQKVVKRAWPDYYTRTYRAQRWNFNQWVWTNEHVRVNCDA